MECSTGRGVGGTKCENEKDMSSRPRGSIIGYEVGLARGGERVLGDLNESCRANGVRPNEAVHGRFAGWSNHLHWSVELESNDWA